MTHSNILYILAIWGFIDLFGSAAVLIGEFPRIYYAWRVRRLRPAAVLRPGVISGFYVQWWDADKERVEWGETPEAAWRFAWQFIRKSEK